MIPLHATSNDDTPFLHLVGRLIDGTARANHFTRVIVGHIDHWFGPRWLGFCGKMLGTAGVRSRRLTGRLTPPPFHPNRVLSVRGYELAESGAFEYQGEVGGLHGFRSSESNIDRRLARGRAYAWYSGDTVSAEKGVVMVYLAHWEWAAAWYVGFNKLPVWHLAQTRAIAPNRVHELLECASRAVAPGPAAG